MRRTFTIVLAVGVLAGTVPARATMLTRPLSLEQMTSEAARIIHARVVDVRSARDESGVPATWTTLEIARSLKGPAVGQLTIKQFGAVTPLPDGAIAAVAGLPSYRVGEEVVLFLRADSGRGFTSPVGLGQGVYRVTTIGGQRVARRDSSPGKEDLAAFLATVARLAAWDR